MRHCSPGIARRCSPERSGVLSAVLKSQKTALHSCGTINMVSRYIPIPLKDERTVSVSQTELLAESYMKAA